MKLASFDIWDTCLTRAFSEPKHLFYEVARRVTTSDGLRGPVAAELARQRITAEQAARTKVPGGECRFEEIEDELRQMVGDASARAFLSEELVVEQAFVRPVVPVRRQLEAARSEGAAIAFISDMYLPTDFLRDLLLAHGFFHHSDSIFVSGQHRVNKSTGELFGIVRQTLKINPADWTHWGDKEQADVRVPRRMGIRAIHYRGTEYTPAEQRAGESCAGDARTASRLKGGMRAARLAGDQPAVLTDVIAPWLCALAAQMVQRAERLGLRRLYFLSRDGEILLRIAKKIAPPTLECRYLYSSRRAWCFPAMLADDFASRRWLETFAVSPRGILGSLEFSPQEQEAILSELKLVPSDSERRADPVDRTFVWDHLRATGRMETVLERAAAARQACLAYLKQEGLFDDDRWAICDVGWVLNGQAALTRLLRTRDPSTAALGFYFMVNRRRPPLSETGPFEAWLLDEALDSDDSSIPRILTQLSGLIEEVFLSSADPSLKGYQLTENEDQALPVFAQTSPDASTRHHAFALRETIDQISDDWQPELRDPAFVEQLCHTSLQELLRFLRDPTRDEATVVSQFQHASEATNQKKHSAMLARPLSLGDGLRILGKRARVVRPSHAPEPLWIAGCQAQTPAWVRRFIDLAVMPLPRFSKS